MPNSVLKDTKSLGAKRRAPTLWFIILVKLGKGALLLVLATAIYRLADNNLPEVFQSVLKFFNLDPERRFFLVLAENLAKVTPSNLLVVAVGTLLYSLFSLVEGTGLIFRVRWAGWMAIGESAFFIPIEIYELMRRFSFTVVGVLLLNILIVWYLLRNRERLFSHH